MSKSRNDTRQLPKRAAQFEQLWTPFSALRAANLYEYSQEQRTLQWFSRRED